MTTEINGNKIYPQIKPLLKGTKFPRAVKTVKGEKFFHCQITGIDSGDHVFGYPEPKYNKKGEILSHTQTVLAYSLPVLARFLNDTLEPEVYQAAYENLCNYYAQKNIPMAPAISLIKQNPGIITNNPDWEQWRNVQLDYTLENYAEDHPPRKRKASSSGDVTGGKTKKAKAKKVRLQLPKGVHVIGMSKSPDKAAKALEDMVKLVSKRRSLSKDHTHFEQVFDEETGMLLEYSTDESKKQNPWIPNARGVVLVSTPKKAVFDLQQLQQ